MPRSFGVGCWPACFSRPSFGQRKEIRQESHPTIQQGLVLRGSDGVGAHDEESAVWAIGTVNVPDEQACHSNTTSGSSGCGTAARPSAEQDTSACFLNSTQASSSLEGQADNETAAGSPSSSSGGGRIIYWQPSEPAPNMPQEEPQPQAHLWEAPALDLFAAPLEPRPPPPSPPHAELLPEQERKSYLDASVLHLQLSLPKIRAPRSFEAPNPRLALSDGDVHSVHSCCSNGDDAEEEGSSSGSPAGAGRTARSCTCSLCCSHGNSSSRHGSCSWAPTPAAASTRGSDRTPHDAIGTPFSRVSADDWSHMLMLTAPLRAAAAAARSTGGSDRPPWAVAPGHDMPYHWRSEFEGGVDVSGLGHGASVHLPVVGSPAGDDVLVEDQVTPLRRDMAVNRMVKVSPAKSFGSSSPGGSSSSVHYHHHHHHSSHHIHHPNCHHHHHWAHMPHYQQFEGQQCNRRGSGHRRQASLGDARQDVLRSVVHDQMPRHASFTAGATGVVPRGQGVVLGAGSHVEERSSHGPPKGSPFASLGGQAAVHMQLQGRTRDNSATLDGSTGSMHGRGTGFAGLRYGWDDAGRAVMVSHVQAPHSGLPAPVPAPAAEGQLGSA